MKIEFWHIGRTRENYVQQGMDIYEKNIKRYCQYQSKSLTAAVGRQKNDTKAYKEYEAQVVLKAIDTGDRLVLLDEAGASYTSTAMAQWLQKTIDTSPRRLIFLIGGAYGFSEKIYQRADHKISLSPMTFPHQLVRVLFLEQLYRAFTIINNQNYHH